MKPPPIWLLLPLLAASAGAAAPAKAPAARAPAPAPPPTQVRAHPHGRRGRDTLPYPASSTSEPVMQAWIDRYLPRKGFVVGAWSPNVVMLVSTDKLRTDRYPEVVAEVWSEVLNPESAAAAGWRAAVEADVFACDRDQYRMVSAFYFKRGDRRGEADPALGDDAWQTPDSGSTMDTVERAACFYGSGKALPAPPGPAGKPAPSNEPGLSLRGLQDSH